MSWNGGYNDHQRGGYGGPRRDDRRQRAPRRDSWGGGRGGWSEDSGYRDTPRQSYREQREPKRDFLYNVGQKLSLRDFPDTTVSVIRIGSEQYECRLPNLQTQWFYEDELVPIETN